MKWPRLMMMAGLVSLAMVVCMAPAAQGVTHVGVYSQPVESFDKWKSRGVNLLVFSELKNGTVKQSDWRSAARDRGFAYIDTYISDDDALDPNLLGWALRGSDEWNRARGNPATRPAVAPLLAEAAKLSALNQARGTHKLIFANADGPGVTTAMWEKPAYPGVANNEKALLPSLTARSVDWYPVTFTASPAAADVARRPLWLPAQAVHRLRTWSEQISGQSAVGSGQVKYVAIVEASKKWNAPLGVTGAQMGETVDYLTGARTFPFPDANAQPVQTREAIDMLVWWTANGKDGPGWDWDVMDADQTAAMVSITSKLLASAAGATTGPTTLPTTLPSQLDRIEGLLNDIRLRQDRPLKPQ